MPPDMSEAGKGTFSKRWTYGTGRDSKQTYCSSIEVSGLYRLSDNWFGSALDLGKARPFTTFDEGNGLWFARPGGISHPTAAVALESKLSSKKARMGEKSRPNNGGMTPRNKFKYGSVKVNTGCSAPIPCAWGNQLRRMRAVMMKL
jgi:hypothetical protein